MVKLTIMKCFRLRRLTFLKHALDIKSTPQKNINILISSFVDSL